VSDDLTIGELGRQVEAVEKRLREEIHKLSERLDRLDFIPAQLYAADKLSMERRMETIEQAHREDHHELRNIRTITTTAPDVIRQTRDDISTIKRRIGDLETWKARTLGIMIGVAIGAGTGTGLLTQAVLG
jgi:small-conductance mechanosensitive channel